MKKCALVLLALIWTGCNKSTLQSIPFPKELWRIESHLNPGYGGYGGHDISIYLSSMPYSISGKFSEMEHRDENEKVVPAKKCKFSFSMSQGESENLSSIISGMRYCEKSGDLMVDGGQRYLILHERYNSQTVNVHYSYTGKPEPVLCANGEAFFSYLTEMIGKHIPSDCSIEWKPYLAYTAE